MYLNQTLPLLFATPSAASSRRAIVFSLLTLVFTFFLYQAAKTWVSFPFFGLMSLLLGMHGYISLTTTGANLFYIFRYFLVWILIFVTAFVWFVYGGEVFVAPYGVEYQTAENTRLLVTAGICSLSGSLMGWHIALSNFKFRQYPEFFMSGRHRRLMWWAGAILAIGFSLLYVWKAGGFVGAEKTYADGQAGFELEFGVFNVFQFMGISLLLIAGTRGDRIQPRYLLLVMFTLALGILVGSRADYLPQTFMIIMLAFNRQIAEALAKEKYFRLIKWFMVAIVMLILGYLSATFVAIWRSGVSPEAVVELMLNSDRGMLINEIYGHKIFYLETGNMMLGGVYSAIVQAGGMTGYLWGGSYFNYLLIAPPAFLGLPRPLGLEWWTSIDGVAMSLGGIFEVAEAYWNFGLIGCLLISFFISYAFGWLLKRGLKYNNYFYLTWYLVYGFMGFRAIWYQNFSYFRIMTVMLVVYVAALLTFRWFVTGRKQSRNYIKKLDDELSGVKV
jgi:hypothetical protein